MSNPKDASPARRPATAIIHTARDPAAQHGFVNPPVYRGSTVLFPDLATLESGKQAFTYGRKGNPTMRALEDALCALEGGTRTILTSSGLSAVTTALLSFAKAGDHVLVADTCYRPTRMFCDEVLTGLGVDITYYDPLLGAGIAALFRPNTRVVYTESPGSQTFEVQDIPAIAAACRAREIWLLMDNTWATGSYFKPFQHGVDVSIQAGTKYVVGHADALLGVVTAGERAAKQLLKMHWLIGDCAGSEEIYLGLRGLRTMDLRLRQHHVAALEMAKWLQQRPEVEAVLHPALPGFPGYELWKRDFSGASGLFSIVLKSATRPGLGAMLDGLKLFGMGYSWGGYESLVVPFDPAQYRSAAPSVFAGRSCLRLHIGLEDVEDLKADLGAGFARLTGAV
jgi:cysteine-S-conjugate beta-lyase